MTLRYRWTILGVGTFAQASYAATAIGLGTLAPALRAHYRLSLGETGVVLAAPIFGLLLSVYPWGIAADRLGERAVIALGLFGAAASLAVTARTGGYPALTAGLAVSGVFGGSVNAASGRAVMSWFAFHERGVALGIRQTSITFGGLIAAASLPSLAHVGGTRLAFEFLAGFCLAGALLTVALLRDDPSGQRRTVRRPRPPAGGNPLADRAGWLLSGGGALFLWTQIALVVFGALFLHDHRGISPRSAGFVLVAMNGFGIVGRVVSGRWSDRSGNRVRPLRVLGYANCITTVAVAAAVDAPLPLLLVLLGVAGVLSLTWNTLAFAAMAERADPSRLGAALGLQQTVFAVCNTILPVAFATIVHTAGWRIAFGLAAVGPLAGTLILRRYEAVDATRPTGARSPGTSASPPAAR